MRKKIGIDIETSGLEHDARIAGVSIYDPETDKSEFYPIHMQGMTVSAKRENARKIKHYLENYALVGHHLMFDLVHLSKLFPKVEFEVAGDSLIIAHMAQLKSGKLKDLVLSYGIAKNDDVVLLDSLVDDYDFTSLSIENTQAIEYAKNDAEWAYKLEKVLAEKYVKSLKLYSLELRVLPVFVEMTVAGMNLDWEGFQKFMKVYADSVEAQKMKLDTEAGFSFRTRSRQDMETIIVDTFNLVPTVRTPKGEYSYSIESLKTLNHPWVEEYLDYSHRFSTNNSMAAVHKHVYKKDDVYRVHPQYKQVGFDGTSRVYTQDPSTNQLPKEFRNYVKPVPGKKFVYMDWSAAELAVAIFWSREARLLKEYNDGSDLHRLIASELLEKPYDQITNEDREISKVVTFSILYGSEGGAAARALGVPFDEGARFVDKFLESFPAIFNLRDRIQQNARRTFRTWTAAGRTRRLRNLSSGRDENKGLRQAFNTAIQSSVADFQKLALIRMNKWVKSLDGRIVTTVFDSFLLEVPEELETESLRPTLDKLFTFNLDGNEWKFQYELKSGWCWGEF